VSRNSATGLATKSTKGAKNECRAETFMSGVILASLAGIFLFVGLMLSWVVRAFLGW
jgi:hypothetical protein